jgi:hypothetical protein
MNFSNRIYEGNLNRILNRRRLGFGLNLVRIPFLFFIP